MKDLVGKVAVVTGAGSGIGRALALRFAAEGMRVALADIDADAAGGTSGLAGSATPGAETLVAGVDVRDGGAVAAFADSVFDRFGQVDLLCNNAGVFVGGYLWSEPVEEIALALDVNLWGILYGIRAFVPRMIEQGTEGHIVNTSSVSGLFGAPFAGPYTLSKFAAFAATESLAGDLIAAGSRLRASVLCPGIIDTNIATAARQRAEGRAGDIGDDERFVTDLLVDLVPGGLDPAQVADCVVDAVRAERFLVLTHEHHAPQLVDRANDLAARRLPTVGDYT